MTMNTFLCILYIVLGLGLIWLGVYFLGCLPRIEYFFTSSKEKIHENLQDVNASLSDIALQIDMMEDFIDSADEFGDKLNNVIDRM